MLKWTHSNKEQYFYSNPEKLVLELILVLQN